MDQRHGVVAANSQRSIGLATVLAGARAFKDLGIANLGETYRGEILTDTGSTQLAIIKDLPQKELANEVVAAAIAHHLSLPVPPAFLAMASTQDLPTQKAPKIPGGAVLFASVEVSSPSISQMVVGNSNQLNILKDIVEHLEKCGMLADFYAFDAWSANVDRHVGNVLFSSNGGPWLIDHGRCFTGPAWVPSDLDPKGRFNNRLREWVTPFLNLASKSRLSAAAHSFAARAQMVDVEAVATANHGASLLAPVDLKALIEFLRERVQSISLESSSALGIPRLVP